ECRPAPLHAPDRPAHSPILRAGPPTLRGQPTGLTAGPCLYDSSAHGRSTAGPTDRRGAGTPDDVPRAATRSASPCAHRGRRARPPVPRVRRAGAPRVPSPQGDDPMRGDGRIFQKPGSRYWHMAYHEDGREVSETTEEADEERARRKLAHRMEEIRRV